MVCLEGTFKQMPLYIYVGMIVLRMPNQTSVNVHIHKLQTFRTDRPASDCNSSTNETTETIKFRYCLALRLVVPMAT